MKMYKTTAIAVFAACVIFAVTGCQPSQSQTPESSAQMPQTSVTTPDKPSAEVESQNPSKIVLTKASHDFGEVGPGSRQKADYAFVNDGTGSLTITGIKSTCGCSQPTLIKGDKRFTIPLKTPVVFEPGQTGKVEVTFKASTAKSKVNKKLYILSDDKDNPRAQLEVKATIVVKVEVEPEKIELQLDKENAGIPDLVVKSTDGQPFSITKVTVGNKVITVPFDQNEKATEFTLKPEVDIEKLKKFGTGVIQISTNHPQAGRLMVRYNAKAMFELSNPRYILQNVEPGQVITRDNLIRSNYGKPAVIETIESRNGYMKLENQEQDGNHIKLKINITPPEQDSSARRYITDELQITLTSGDILKVRCSGWFRVK